MSPTTIAGIVLCGGASRRMGRDKATLPFGAETLLQRVVRQLGGEVSPIIVVAAANQSLPRLPADVTVLRDPIPGRGPWQGIATGLHHLNGTAEAAFITSCDSPFLAPGWIGRLRDLLGSDSCAVPLVDEHPQPLAALYRIEVVGAIERLLRDSARRPLDLFSLVPTRFVAESELRDVDPDLQTLRNLNTRSEYEAARVALECDR